MRRRAVLFAPFAVLLPAAAPSLGDVEISRMWVNGRLVYARPFGALLGSALGAALTPARQFAGPVITDLSPVVLGVGPDCSPASPGA
jgi:hypothetical protein